MEFLRTHKILVGLGLITLIILLALIVAGSLYLAKQPTSMPDAVDEFESGIQHTNIAIESEDLIIAEDAVTIATTKGSVVYALSSSTNEAVNGSTLFDETIFVWDPTTTNEYGLVQLKNSAILSQVQLVGTKLYYIQGSDLIALDLASKERALIIRSVSNFLIANDRLWYVISRDDLKPIIIGVIDLKTMARNDIITDIQAQLGDDNFLSGGLAVRSYNSTDNSLTLVSVYGDAGCSSVQLFKLDLNSKQIKQVDSEVYCMCDEETGNGCPNDATAQAHVQELRGADLECQGTQVSHDDIGNLVFTNPRAKKVAGSASYVGCIE
jgi:hypothetical protein